MTDLTLTSENERGDLTEIELSFEQAAALQRGEPVAAYGLVKKWTNEERVAAIQARQDQIDSRLHELEDENPELHRG